MVKESSVNEIDETLVRRLAALPPGTQRWLKTVLQTVRAMPGPRDPEVEWEGLEAVEQPERTHPSPLEDVIQGKAKLDDQLEAYPDLADELEGIGDVIDMLRDLGESRRRRGSDILREEILGEPPHEDEPGGPGLV
jgi:hypothetical protein